MKSIGLALILVFFLAPAVASGDVFRWDNGALIPGTEGVNPAPSAQFDNLALHFANLRNLDLTNSSFANADLTHARLIQSTLTGRQFHRRDRGIDESGRHGITRIPEFTALFDGQLPGEVAHRHLAWW